MQAKSLHKNQESSNLVKQFIFRYLPYWPLFALFIILFEAGAWFYMHNVPPSYKITASIMVRDQNKGLLQSDMSRTFNVYNFAQIVENETEVLKSKELLKKVATRLNLYAPVYEKNLIWSRSAYHISPIVIKLKNPDDPKYYKSEGDTAKVFFTFDSSLNAVKIKNNVYPLDQWVNTPYGPLLFTRNNNQFKATTKPLFFYFASPKEVTADLAESIQSTQTSKFSSFVNLTFHDEIPERGEAILNELMDVYDSLSIKDRQDLSSNTLAFINERVQETKKDVDSVERALKQYKAQKGIVNLSEQGSLYLQSVATNDQQIASINMQLAALDQVEKYVVSKNNSDGIVPSTLGIDNAVLSNLLSKLYESELEYDRLKKTTGENNPVLSTLSSQIEKIRPGILENIVMERRSLEASKKNLGLTNNMSSSKLNTIPEKERELLQISRQQSLKNDLYTYLLQKKEEAALSLSGNDINNKIIDHAQAEIKPESPKKRLVYAGALIFALAFGIGLISARDFLNSKILFRSEIEDATSVPVIAEISNVKGKPTIIVDQPKHIHAAEQFRQLRVAIGLHSKNRTWKKILVTSSISGEGKGFVSNNLALSLAQTGRKVVLIDLDLRNPQTSRVFGLHDTAGVREFLDDFLEPYQIIKKTSYKNLYVIPAGAIPDNPSDLLLNGRIEVLFDYLAHEFDYIIADISPVDPLTDAYVLSEFFDTTLYVVRHGVTPKQMISLMDENNKIKAFKELALVFNGVKSRGLISKRYGYGYGYGYQNVYKNKTYLGR